MSLKKGLISIAVSLPLTASATFGSEMSLEQLKQRCIDFRQNAQIERFSIKLSCKGNYTVWEAKDAETTLFGKSTVQSKISSKGDRWRTAPESFNYNIPGPEACHDLVKMKISSPAGIGISDVVIDRCEDLNQDFIAEVCNDQVEKYCNDQMMDVNGSEASNEESCKVEELERINTCVSR